MSPPTATSASNSESDGVIDQWHLGVRRLSGGERGRCHQHELGAAPGTSQVHRDVMDYANGLGSILVAAAGNDSTSAIHYPSGAPGVISVAAVGSTDRKTSYSNYGLSVDIASPGGSGINGLMSTIPSGGYARESGNLDGITGDRRRVRPREIVPPGVVELAGIVAQILGTADPIDDVNQAYVGQLGHGRVNAYEALVGVPSTAEPGAPSGTLGVSITDEGGDGGIEAGESAELAISLQNYNHLAGSKNLTLTLHSNDKVIKIDDATITISIGADSIEEVEETFSVSVASNARRVCISSV